MTKREFQSFLTDELEKLPAKEQLQLISIIENLWLPEIRKKKREEINEKYVRCFKCDIFYPKDDLEVKERQEPVKEKVLITGPKSNKSEDILVDVVDVVKYCVCPNCNNEIELDRYTVKEEKRYYRFETRKGKC